MKKTLIALAALAATASFAQSSVTLYGVADVSLAQTTRGSVAASANGTMNNGNSRIGFRGVEDLGGGLKASFAMEGNVNLANGSTSGPDAGSTTPLTFSRAAWLALSGGFGEVKVGRQFDPEFNAIASYELTGAANYSAVANTFGTTLRDSGMATYTTPNMGGLTAQIGVILPGNSTCVGSNGCTAAATSNGKTALNVVYAAGPIAAAASYSKVDNAADSAWTLGGSYNLGVAKIAVGLYDPVGAVKGFSVGATMPIGAASVTVDIARDNGSAVNGTNYLLEGKYPLSKRTTVYAAFLRVDGRGATDVNNLGLGIRHNF